MSENENTKNVDFSAMCRICLKSKLFLINLYESEAARMLRFCGFIEIEESQNLPNKICDSCNELLEGSYKLKQLCISSNIYLQSWANAQETLEETDVFASVVKQENNLKESVAKDTSCETSANAFVYKSSDFEDKSKNLRDFEEIILTQNIQNCVNNCNNQRTDLLRDNYDDDTELLDKSIGFIKYFNAENKTTYKCNICNLSYEYKQDFLVHQSVHGKSCTCNACDKKFQTLKSLKRHLKTHMVAKAHKCKICNKGFTESSDVTKHQKRHHLGIPREKKYQCESCEQKFTDLYYLKVHKRKHTGEKPLECDICYKSFYDPRSLNTHMDTHKGIKRYLCNYCGKAFIQSTHLKQHIVVHTQEKPYTCNICSKKFTQTTSLQRHQKVHMARNTCALCAVAFLSKQELDEHKEEEHDIKTNSKKNNSKSSPT